MSNNPTFSCSEYLQEGALSKTANNSIRCSKTHARRLNRSAAQVRSLRKVVVGAWERPALVHRRREPKSVKLGRRPYPSCPTNLQFTRLRNVSLIFGTVHRKKNVNLTVT